MTGVCPQKMIPHWLTDEAGMAVSGPFGTFWLN
jgi:hypothetical protein